MCTCISTYMAVCVHADVCVCLHVILGVLCLVSHTNEQQTLVSHTNEQQTRCNKPAICKVSCLLLWHMEGVLCVVGKQQTRCNRPHQQTTHLPHGSNKQDTACIPYETRNLVFHTCTHLLATNHTNQQQATLCVCVCVPLFHTIYMCVPLFHTICVCVPLLHTIYVCVPLFHIRCVAVN